MLAACGGGGGGGSSVPNTPVTQVTPTPTPAPTPFALSDAFTYQGTQQSSTVFAYPSPSPYPAKTSSMTITQSIVVNSSPYPGGAAPNAGDFHDVESDAGSLVTHVLTSDTWIAANGAALAEYGSIVKDDSGDTFTTNYTTPYDLSGAVTNSALATVTEQYADGSNSARSYRADGSYTETGTVSPGFSEQLSENADGSGSYTSDGFLGGGIITGFTYSAASGSTVTISENMAPPPTPTPNPTGQPTPTPNPQPTPILYTVPAWYGATPQLYAETTSVAAGSAYPAGCSVPASYGTSGPSVARTVRRTDTILGYTERIDTTSYEGAHGLPVCVVMQDVQTNYYDYQDDFRVQNGGYHFHFIGTPLSTATITQTLTLQQGAVIHSGARRTSGAQSLALDPRVVTAAQSSFMTRVYRARHEREQQFARALKSLRAKGAAR